MRKLSFTLALLGLSITCMAQNKPVEATKVLPATLTFTITRDEFQRIDTAVNVYSRIIDSKAQTSNYLNALKSFYEQVNKQLVVKGVKP